MSLNIRPKNCYEHRLQFRQNIQNRQQHPRGIIELNGSLQDESVARQRACSIGVGTCWKLGGEQEVAVINYKLILVNNY